MLRAAAALLCLAAGCSGQPSPPDMPPFPGTDAFLEERVRVRRMALADELFREKYNLGDPVAMEMRAQKFLHRQLAVAERSRQIELAKEQERLRRDRERAEEGRLRFEALERANLYRPDLRRERERAEEGRLRFAQIREANQRREDLTREKEKEEQGRHTFAEAEFLSAHEKRETIRKEQERREEGRLLFGETQARRMATPTP